ncbi:Protein VACUOLELESS GAMETOPHYTES [Cardamine amara subsp. amara]|uniref:Protein VACUOLELESS GAMETOPHYTES n=1 Tax=Cardamine amara subsp. amara TaxID=228776 RepID=A0ABD1AF98_CARAN
MDSDSETEMKLISLITQLMCINGFNKNEKTLMSPIDFVGSKSMFRSLCIQLISLVSSMDLDSQPKPESELMSLTTQLSSLFNSIDLDFQPTPLSELMSLTEKYFSLFNSKVSDQEPKLESEFMSLIYRMFSLVVSKNSMCKKLISLCPQVQVRLGKEEFQVIEQVSWSSNDKWLCLPLYWQKCWLAGEDATHFRCRGCNGRNHEEYDKAPLEVKHPLHPKHSLQLSLLNFSCTRECYCCDELLLSIFYYCSACDYSMNMACVEKPRVLSIDYPKWHEHTLALFPRKTSLTCSLCALTHSSCAFYICPPCDFVVHQRCINLPRVIRISRHLHRISFTPSFDQGDWFCGVCRRKINNDYGGYSCIKDGCSYAAHSKCATQSNVWDGKDLEGEPEEIEEEELEPFKTISDGIIQHFSHQHHHLRLDENMVRDYDDNKQCQACITPIYFGNFYSCMQCDFILHEECAKLSRKIHHPIHPHMLTLVGGHDGVIDATNPCPCPLLCTAGFFYECGKEGLCFKLHVSCVTISEPLFHESHTHPLFLTSKPGELRRCSVCKRSGHCSTTDTFNCIEECDFALCFGCATLPQKVRYKHDKHMLTLSYGTEPSTTSTTYWCEVCEEVLNPKERFYTCDEYCCLTIHINCMLGPDLYMKPGSSWIYRDRKVHVLPNNLHMSRPTCSDCGERCPHRIVLQSDDLMFCSTDCIPGMLA